MILEDATPLFHNANAPSGLASLTKDFGRLHELPPTKSMKTFTKNLIAKIERLQKRLLSYANLARITDDDGWLYNPLDGSPNLVEHNAVKKFYQFRLVGIDTMRKSNLEHLNRAVSTAVAASLYTDVNEDLNDAKEKLSGAPTFLSAELNELKDSAIASSLLDDTDKIKMGEYWDQLIKYNSRLLEQHLLKLKGQQKAQPGTKEKEKALQPAQKQTKKVFVNVHLEKRVSIPSFVFRTLNLGANFQVCSLPTQRSLRNSWQEARGQILKKTGGGQKIGSAVINLIDSFNDRRFCNINFINKVLRNSGLRKAANINLTLRRVYEFLVDNDLIVVLADKNLGLTIVNKDWYHKHMLAHFDDTEMFSYIDTNAAPALVCTVDSSTVNWTPLIKKLFFRLKSVVRTYFVNEKDTNNFLAKYWDESNVVFPQTYGLAKLHKNPVVLRYITPVTSWVNVSIKVQVKRNKET
ncbi:hypothetical protein RhiirA4_486532 [Rhizophagus irregularis]|uniref:Uncharacterized protein n=1 Tax=Rhizophagus irregularis TaxID=588596 RepID=A0A2I1HRQ6_9GLOM|nr:hypothetical protein RhiirA4_486532 [Rhizophagus irregularis]